VCVLKDPTAFSTSCYHRRLTKTRSQHRGEQHLVQRFQCLKHEPVARDSSLLWKRLSMRYFVISRAISKVIKIVGISKLGDTSTVSIQTATPDCQHLKGKRVETYLHGHRYHHASYSAEQTDLSGITSLSYFRTEFKVSVAAELNRWYREYLSGKQSHI